MGGGIVVNVCLTMKSNFSKHGLNRHRKNDKNTTIV